MLQQLKEWLNGLQNIMEIVIQMKKFTVKWQDGMLYGIQKELLKELSWRLNKNEKNIVINFRHSFVVELRFS